MTQSWRARLRASCWFAATVFSLQLIVIVQLVGLRTVAAMQLMLEVEFLSSCASPADARGTKAHWLRS